MIASRSCCRLSAAHPLMRNLPSTTSQRCSIEHWDRCDVEAIWVKWSPLSCSKNSQRWFELCDMVHYPAGSNHQKMVTLSHKGGHGQQQYSGRLWCLNDAQLVLRVPKCAKKYLPHPLLHPPPKTWTVRQGRMDPCLHVLICQILTPTIWMLQQNSRPPDQATFFQSFIVQFWWACANCSLVSCS